MKDPVKTILFLSLLVLLPSLAVAEPLPRCKPGEVDLDETTLAKIDTLVEAALTDEKVLAGKSMGGPGCVVCIGRHGKIAFLKGYGDKKTGMAFEIFSMTKPTATAASIMLLAERGKLDVDAKAAEYLKEFDTPEKRDITVRHLLLHSAGFPRYWTKELGSMEKILAVKPLSKPGEKFRYSDLSYIMLGEIVSRVSGKNVADFAREEIFLPLGMNDTGYLPNEKLEALAPQRPGRKRGNPSSVVHLTLAVPVGSSGLSATADDLAVYATMMLNRGEFRGKRIMKAETVEKMTSPNPIPSGTHSGKPTEPGVRGLGWAMQVPGDSRNRPETMSPEAFGHGGWLGTSFWMDPKYDLFVIFLSDVGPNRVYPLASKIGDVAVESITNK